jgi:class 3 adenylate cyclase
LSFVLRRQEGDCSGEIALPAGKSAAFSAKGPNMPAIAEMPKGTVTFLFTDIEGSTRLWEAHARAMQAAVARHDVLLRQAIETNEGYVFKTVGDAFCAAFPTAPQALFAALACQRALQSADWESTGPIKVRMALHTGVAEVRDNDYFGLPLNRVARLLSTGYGGQVLLSLATQQLVRDHLPQDTSLKDLGEGGLKDLVKAEHVYQVVAPDLPSHFPPLKSLDTQYVEQPLQRSARLPGDRCTRLLRQGGAHRAAPHEDERGRTAHSFPGCSWAIGQR